MGANFQELTPKVKITVMLKVFLIVTSGSLLVPYSILHTRPQLVYIRGLSQKVVDF